MGSRPVHGFVLAVQRPMLHVHEGIVHAERFLRLQEKFERWKLFGRSHLDLISLEDMVHNYYGLQNNIFSLFFDIFQRLQITVYIFIERVRLEDKVNTTNVRVMRCFGRLDITVWVLESRKKSIS